MDYYESRFTEDIRRYCEGRSDAALFGPDAALAGLGAVPDARRHIRFGTDGWEPEAQVDFYFSLYFTVLTDMVLHSHFPASHPAFDNAARYPKLLGMGFTQRLLPESALGRVRFRRSGEAAVLQSWRSYCAYFIRDWQEGLPSVCQVDGLDFLRAVRNDPDIRSSAKHPKLLYAEHEAGGVGRPDGEGDCFDPSGHLQSVLLDLVGDEVRRLEEARR